MAMVESSREVNNEGHHGKAVIDENHGDNVIKPINGKQFCILKQNSLFASCVIGGHLSLL